MTNYYLRKWSDPVLRQKCEKVEDFSKLGNLVNSMLEIMNNHEGIGIAAPQIGDTRQVLIAKVNSKYQVFVNPEIKKARGFIPYLEGCLSFPGLTVPTLRKYSIDVEYQNTTGKKLSQKFSGVDSIVMQHEIDHLNGKLMFNYLKK